MSRTWIICLHASTVISMNNIIIFGWLHFGWSASTLKSSGMHSKIIFQEVYREKMNGIWLTRCHLSNNIPFKVLSERSNLCILHFSGCCFNENCPCYPWFPQCVDSRWSIFDVMMGKSIFFFENLHCSSKN